MTFSFNGSIYRLVSLLYFTSFWSTLSLNPSSLGWFGTTCLLYCFFKCDSADCRQNTLSQSWVLKSTRIKVNNEYYKSYNKPGLRENFFLVKEVFIAIYKYFVKIEKKKILLSVSFRMFQMNEFSCWRQTETFTDLILAKWRTRRGSWIRRVKSSNSLSTFVLNELRKFVMNYSVNESDIENWATLFPVCSSVDNRSLVTRKFLLNICVHF